MKSSDEILMDKIMKVVNEHLDDPALNVEMLASEVGLSRVHVHRKLKELTNLSARDFIKNIRLQQAATLLAQDQKLTISEMLMPRDIPTCRIFPVLSAKNMECLRKSI